MDAGSVRDSSRRGHGTVRCGLGERALSLCEHADVTRLRRSVASVHGNPECPLVGRLQSTLSCAGNNEELINEVDGIIKIGWNFHKEGKID